MHTPAGAHAKQRKSPSPFLNLLIVAVTLGSTVVVAVEAQSSEWANRATRTASAGDTERARPVPSIERTLTPNRLMSGSALVSEFTQEVASATVSLEVSSASAAPGTRIAVALRADIDGPDPLAAIHGTLRFDPGKLRYVGQAVDSGNIAMVNAERESSGELILTIANLPNRRPAGLTGRALVLSFSVAAPNYAATLAFTPVGLADRALHRHQALAASAAQPARVDLPVPLDAQRLTRDDWERIAAQGAPKLPPGLDEDGGPSVAEPVGSTLIYGDPSGDGVANISDAVLIIYWLNHPGTTPGFESDVALAANVLPFPGDPSGAWQPGWFLDCSAAIDVGDYTAIINYSVYGNVPVVGTPIPSGTPHIPPHCVATQACSAAP